MNSNFFKGRKNILILVVFAAVITIIISVSREISDRNNELTEVTPLDNPDTVYNSDYIYSADPDLEANKARENVSNLSESLPIDIYEFPTSTGIVTSIGIYVSPSDPNHFVRVEINGIDYIYIEDEATLEKDPNVIAFKESFEEVIKRITEHEVDPKELYFVFGTRQYINEISSDWVDQLNLLN